MGQATKSSAFAMRQIYHATGKFGRHGGGVEEGFSCGSRSEKVLGLDFGEFQAENQFFVGYYADEGFIGVFEVNFGLAVRARELLCPVCPQASSC